MRKIHFEAVFIKFFECLHLFISIDEENVVRGSIESLYLIWGESSIKVSVNFGVFLSRIYL